MPRDSEEGPAQPDVSCGFRPERKKAGGSHASQRSVCVCVCVARVCVGGGADNARRHCRCLPVYLCTLHELAEKNELFYQAHKLIDAHPQVRPHLPLRHHCSCPGCLCAAPAPFLLCLPAPACPPLSSSSQAAGRICSQGPFRRLGRPRSRGSRSGATIT